MNENNNVLKNVIREDKCTNTEKIQDNYDIKRKDIIKENKCVNTEAIKDDKMEGDAFIVKKMLRELNIDKPKDIMEKISKYKATIEKQNLELKDYKVLVNKFYC